MLRMCRLPVCYDGLFAIDLFRPRTMTRASMKCLLSLFLFVSLACGPASEDVEDRIRPAAMRGTYSDLNIIKPTLLVLGDSTGGIYQFLRNGVGATWTSNFSYRFTWQVSVDRTTGEMRICMRSAFDGSVSCIPYVASDNGLGIQYEGESFSLARLAPATADSLIRDLGELSAFIR